MRADRIGLTLLVVTATLALGWIVAPFRSAIIWAIAGSVLFLPLADVLDRLSAGRRNLAAALSAITMTLCLIVPALAAGAALVHEASHLAARGVASTSLPMSVGQVHASLPSWLHRLLRFAARDDATSVQAYLGRLIEGGLGSIAGAAIGLGQSAFGLAVSLGMTIYLSFFCLRDGRAIWETVLSHLPVPDQARGHLGRRISDALKVTLRGTLLVAAIQGAVGGTIFWLVGIEAPAVWGFAMALTSLLPPFGAGAIWLPVATFLVLTGSVGQGTTLLLCGLFIIGLVDNLVRPLLIGRGAHLPEYMVLLATLGGLALLGLDGLLVGPLGVALFQSAWQTWDSETR